MVVRLSFDPELTAIGSTPVTTPAQQQQPAVETKRYADKATLSVNSPQMGERVDISSESPYDAGERETMTALSEAATFLTVAQDAATEVKRLVSELNDTVEKIGSSIDPNEREALATEAADIVAEIDSVNEAANFNSGSVINAGTLVFGALPDGEDLTGASSYSVTVQNIALSTQDLGLASLTPDDFAADPEGIQGTTLADAERMVSQITAQVTDAAKQLGKAAQSFGSDRAGEARAVQTDGEAEQLAHEIAVQIRESNLDHVRELDRGQVERLLSEDRETKEPAAAGEKEQNALSQQELEGLGPVKLP